MTQMNLSSNKETDLQTQRMDLCLPRGGREGWSGSLGLVDEN